MNQRPDTLHRQVEAAKELRLQIAILVAGDLAAGAGVELSDDDKRTIQDTFEGETSLDVELESAVQAEDDDKIMIEGIEKRLEDLKARQARIKKRIDARRGLIEQAMAVAGWTKKELALGTLSIGKGSLKVEVDDESIIPTQFWKRAEPTLSKTDLGAALREHQKKVDAALKIKSVETRAEALMELTSALPQDPTVNKRIIEAMQFNDPQSRASAFEMILASVSPIPGAHLERGQGSLTITRK